MRYVFLLVLSAVVGCLIAWLVYAITLPKPIPDDPLDSRATSQTTYLKSIYLPTDTDNFLPKIELLNFVWNNASTDVRKTFPIAHNTSIAWPPPKGQRTRIVAFPYPSDIRKGHFWHNINQAIKLLLNSTADKATFPGWLVSIYDPQNPNANLYGKRLKDYFKEDWNTFPLWRQSSTPQYLEILHACYPPVNKEYPFCDDGGYWMYMAPGSGVFWNSGKTVLIANNKLHAVQQLVDHIKANLWQYLLLVEKNPSLNTLLFEIGNSKDGVSFIANRWRDAAESKQTNLMGAINDVVQQWGHLEGSQSRSVLLVAFRSMQTTDTRATWAMTIATTSVILTGVLTTIAYVVYSWIRLLRKRWPQDLRMPVLKLVVLAVVIVLLYNFVFYIVLDRMLRGFGWRTLPSALQETGMSLEDFIQSAIDDTSYTHPGTPNKSLVANGANSTQTFDTLLEELMAITQVQSCIMHAQPNKGGVWAVEILDMRQFLKDPKANTKLGICGIPMSPSDSLDDDIDDYKLMEGPLQSNNVLLGYQPKNPCKCDDTKDIMCTNCGTDSISGRLCAMSH